MSPSYKQVSPTYHQINRGVTGSLLRRPFSLKIILLVQFKVHNNPIDRRDTFERSAAMAAREWATLHHIQRARHLHTRAL